MYQGKKRVLEYMFLASTLAGISGVYFLYKQLVVLGWILVCVWVVLAVIVRVLIVTNWEKIV
jgi:hypothetical protein